MTRREDVIEQCAKVAAGYQQMAKDNLNEGHQVVFNRGYREAARLIERSIRAIATPDLPAGDGEPEAKFVYSSVTPKFADDEALEPCGFKIWVHTTLEGTDQDEMYDRAKALIAKLNTRPTPTAGDGDMREAIARALCVEEGDDPDREGPWAEWWEQSAYARSADVALAFMRPSTSEAGLRSALEEIARSKFGLGNIISDHGQDTNAYNYHAMKYWRDLAMGYQRLAANTLAALQSATPKEGEA